VRENWIFFVGAKCTELYQPHQRRKNAAHGASRGEEAVNEQAPKGRKKGTRCYHGIYGVRDRESTAKFVVRSTGKGTTSVVPQSRAK